MEGKHKLKIGVASRSKLKLEAVKIAYEKLDPIIYAFKA